MRKKHLLSVGALALALGLGVAAMNAGSLLSLPFAAVLTADEPTVTYLTFKEAIPANESIIPNWQNMQECTFEFTNDSPGTFPGIEVNSECTEKIQVQRSTTGTFYDDSTIWEIDPTDKNAVYVDSKYQGRLHVVFPAPLTLFSSASSFTYYKVILPEGLVCKARGVEVTPEGDDSGEIQLNKSVSVEYTVKKMASYTTTPKSGATVATLSGGLQNVSVNYEEGATVSLTDNSAKAKLYLVNPAASPAETEVGTYSISVADTKVNLTYDSEDQPALTTGQQKYKIVVPANVLEVKQSGAFWGDSNQEIVIENLGLVFMDINALELIDVPEAGSEVPVKEIPQEFIVAFPVPMNFANKNVSLYCEGSTLAVANYKGVAAPNGMSVTYTMVPGTSATSKVGRPEWWSNGKYYFRFPASSFTEKSSGKASPQMDTPMWNGIDGITVDPFTYMTCNVSRTFYENGAKITPSPEIEFKDAAMSAIPAKTGVGEWVIRFLVTCKPNVENTTAKIRLMKEGQAEPLFEEGTSDKVGGLHHLWKNGTAPWMSKTEEAIANVTSWNVYYEMTDEPWYDANAAGSQKYRKYGFLKTPGNYTLVVDEGFFIDKDGVPSQAVAAPFTIIGDIEATLAPADGETVDAIQTVTVTYPEGATVSVPADTKLQLTRKFSTSSKDKNLPYFNVTGSGNVVTLELEEPFTESGTDFKVNIPGNVWQVTYDGSTQPNAQMEAYYNVNSVHPGTLNPAPNMDGEPLLGTALNSIVYTAPTLISEITGNASLYYVGEGEGENRQLIASYTAKLPTNSEGDAVTSNVITWTTTDDLSNAPAGNYVFEIPEDALKYAGYTTKVTATEPFTFDYKFRDPLPKFANVFAKVDPTSNVVYTIANGGHGFNTMAFEYKNAQLQKGTAQIQLLFEGEKIAEFGLSSSAVYMEEPIGNFAGILELNFEDAVDFNFATVGTYTVVIPDGLFTLEGEALAGVTYNVSVEVKPVDFTYTLDPAAGSEVESLEEIILTFPNASDLMYASDKTHPVATLTSEDGTQVLNCVYPKPSGNSLILKFGDSNTEWIKGKYTLTVCNKAINLGDPQWDDSEVETGNFEGLTAEYTYTGAAHVEMGKITDYINLAVPSSTEADVNNTMSGMAVLGFGLATTDFSGVAGADFLEYYYQADATATPELLTTLNADNSSRVMIYGGGAWADDEFPTFTPVRNLFLMLGGDADGVNEEDLPLYTREGYYTLVIPDGAFKAEGKLLEGTSITYHYVNEIAPFTMDYTLTPDPEATITENVAATFFNTGITITFPEANQIDCYNSCATLTMPDGTVLTKVSPSTNFTNNLTWKFGKADTNWINGVYEFEILPGKVGVNMGWSEDWDGKEANFPGLKVVYNVNVATGIYMIGVDKADFYNVFTLDGKVVKLNAKAENMLDLEPGMYIINGKKAIVRK